MQQPSSSGNQEQHLRAQLELLQSHDAETSTASGSCDSRSALSHSPPARTANGYEELAAASHEAARALSKTQAESHIHPDLRATPGHPSNMMPMGPPSGHSPGGSPSGPPNTSIAPAPSSSAPEPGAAGDGRRAKRELSQSKRAAQNRAAQRAFRQRKEGYIKKLEQQVRDYAEMEQTYKAVQAENYALREYVIHLQSRLIDTQGEYPPPPPNVNLSQSSAAQPPPASAPEQAPNPGVGTPLEAVAQAVAGLAAQEQLAESQGQYPSPEYKPEPRDEDSRTVDEINRQLHQQSEENSGRSADV
ncbi:transmembrane protein [Metarhizium acridum CQMa 102]|uniref:Putative transcription factor kapC n=1 Tax=Metarhizium acridum (strain CQMa 102) TaxID=655827 RepID=E9E954_METAQ|nr:uncharacterized protein MAC_06402 [Metarhizium acridum CQMa 102]EFY87558.1 transmembrane protein [Metarhizium acridum CQMa 102]